MSRKNCVHGIFRIFLSVFFTASFLLTGCRQSAPGASVPPQPSSAVSAPSPEESSSPVLRLSKILDGKKYEGKFAIWTFSIHKTDDSGKVNAGDTALLRSPDGKTMLIDTGYRETISEVLDEIEQIGVTKLDYLVATHMHSDHVGGVGSVLDAMPVGKVLTSRFAYRKVGAAVGFMTALESRAIKPQIVKEGDSFSFGEKIAVEVLNPEDAAYEIPDDSYSNQNTVNENSVVLKMTYGGKKFLFTGDIQRGTEQRLVEKYGGKLDVDYIKVPHHGYSTSSSRLFIKALTPEVAVVPQCLMPNMDVYDRYQSANSKIYVNGLDGLILTVCDGKKLQVITEKDRIGRLKP